MTTINTAASPYFDDFSADSKYHQILFKPGYAVQARELTQTQSILQEQIRKFGNHIFQQGSIVIPGNSFIDDQSNYVKLESTVSSVAVNLSLFEGKTIESVATGVRAIIRKIVPASGIDPLTFYITYINGGGSTNLFTDVESLRVIDNPTATVITKTSCTGTGTLAFVNKGVYYVNGFFVGVDNQSVVVDKYTQNANASVLLKINQSIATSETDSSLFDPAQGSNNYAAPGADRLKIDLELVVLPLASAITNDYIEIMRVVDGVLQYHSRFPKYSELERSLARRTYDESGDFIVNGFDFTVREHKKVGRNNGMYVNGNIDKVIYNVKPGKAYVEGYEVEAIAESNLVVDKARTAAHIKSKSNVTFRPSFGQYIYVSDLKRLPDFTSRENIELWNTSDSTDGAATLVGHARVLGIDYVKGDIDSGNGIFALYIYDLNMIGTYKLESNVGGIRHSTGSAIVLDKVGVPSSQNLFTVGEVVNSGSYSAKIRFHDLVNGEAFIYKYDKTKLLPLYGQTILGVTSGTFANITFKISIETVSANNSALFYVPVPNVKELRTSANTVDMSYVVWKKLSITTNSSGAGSVSITEGTIVNLEQSNLIATSSTGIVTFSHFSLSGGGTTLSCVGGPVSVTIDIFVNINKTNLQERTKTLTTFTDAGLTSTPTIMLTKYDCYDIVSITSSVNGDVTSRYNINSGQKDYIYDLGSITLSGVQPTGTISVTYRYFEHSSSGDYFTVDSYKTLGSDYLNQIPEYISQFNAQVIPLKFAMDFRKVVSATAAMLMPATLVSTSAKFYVPRVDIITINKSGVLNVIAGEPNEKPVIPNTPSGEVLLRTITIPAFTDNIKNIRNVISKNRRYTMVDINELNSRVEHVEEYSTLNALERDLVSMEIVDAGTGLNRYKTGFLVDNFKNPYVISDVYSPFFNCEYDKQTLRPSREYHEVLLSVDASASNFTKLGNLVTLPYTERVLAIQPNSTRVINLNPFLVFSWEGTMTITPPMDSWVEREDLPTVFATVNNTIVVNTVIYDYVSIPVNPMDMTLGVANRNGTFTWAPGVNQSVVDGMIASGQISIPTWQPPDSAQVATTITPLRDGGVLGSPTIFTANVVNSILANETVVNQARVAAGAPVLQTDWSSINTN